jgi:hypothetical protein
LFCKNDVEREMDDELLVSTSTLPRATSSTQIRQGRGSAEHDVPGSKLGKVSDYYQIVGGAQDAKYYDLRETPRSTGYAATEQNDHPDSGAQILVRANAPMGSVGHQH